MLCNHALAELEAICLEQHWPYSRHLHFTSDSFQPLPLGRFSEVQRTGTHQYSINDKRLDIIPLASYYLDSILYIRTR